MLTSIRRRSPLDRIMPPDHPGATATLITATIITATSATADQGPTIASTMSAALGDIAATVGVLPRGGIGDRKQRARPRPTKLRRGSATNTSRRRIPHHRPASETSRSSVVPGPARYAAFTAPTEVPTSNSGAMPWSCKAAIIPTWMAPRLPPPVSTKAVVPGTARGSGPPGGHVLRPAQRPYDGPRVEPRCKTLECNRSQQQAEVPHCDVYLALCGSDNDPDSTATPAMVAGRSSCRFRPRPTNRFQPRKVNRSRLSGIPLQPWRFGTTKNRDLARMT